MPRTSDSQVDPCIVFEGVRKTFTLRHGKFFKEAVIAALTRKNHSTKFNAVDDLSFEVFPGEAVAVLGRNGSGKSTTLKLLSGVLRPDAGWIGTQGRVAGLLEVGAGFHPDLTGRDNVYLNAAILGMSKQETDERFDEIVEFAEIGEFIDTEVKRYSSGMYSRLGFAVAVHTELDVLLVDEVLSVGDAEFREKCNAKMKELQQQGKTMFIVSHNAAQVKQLCQRGIVLDHGKKVFDGPIAEAVEMLNPKRKNAAPPQQTKAPEQSKSAPQEPSRPKAEATTKSQTSSPQETTPTARPAVESVPSKSVAERPAAPKTPRISPEPPRPPAEAPAVPAAATVTAAVHTEPAEITQPQPSSATEQETPLTPKPVTHQPGPDTLQARLAAMNRLKEREADERKARSAAHSSAPAPVREPDDRGPKHGA